ncbi:MAG: nucleotidyl transferase AbiEii/AbiGii toxin family protein [Campylobacterota bacterium]|nr:nucleotidyl transferase AbiEii/AbiGii toxin family protein [Campylobacterota bacterium]
MKKFNFKEQSKLLNIAVQILEDYDIQEWSFGGGTALSTVYYNHRMSYDIDIFSQDFSAIEIIRENYKEIASNLNISNQDVAVSPSGVTFLLSSDTHGLKIDFLYSTTLADTLISFNNLKSSMKRTLTKS